MISHFDKLIWPRCPGTKVSRCERSPEISSGEASVFIKRGYDDDYGRTERQKRSKAVTGVRAFAVVAMALAISDVGSAADTRPDATETAFKRCLDLPANASTAGQTDCETVAGRTYDKRMNAAYATLMRRLPAGAADRLRRSQRAWLLFRDAEAATRSAIYATRQGTMYVPMEADDAVTLVEDRARLLERYVHALDIE